MNRRQRLLTRPRFTAPGKVTNYEMRLLREQDVDGCCREIWQSVSHAFHPHTLDEWLMHRHQGDDPWTPT